MKALRSTVVARARTSDPTICHFSHFLSATPSRSLFPSPSVDLSLRSSSSSSSTYLRFTRVTCQKSTRLSRPITRASSMASSTPSPPAETKPFSVLFVCLGNICRSPAAEGVFRDLVKKKGFDSMFLIDSAGTINYHEGNPADSRMRSAAKKRGVEITSMSRPIKPTDFTEFDLILAMDKQNRSDICEFFNRWKEKYNLPADAYKKVKLMCSYCKNHDEDEVPDPYYGGTAGFEKVLDLLEDACGSLLSSVTTADGNE